MPAVRHTLLPHWLGLCDVRCENPPVDLGALKQALIKRQLNSRGWRLYLDYGDALFECLGRPWVDPDWMFSSAGNAATFLCLLQACEMDVLPPPELVRSMAEWNIPQNRLSLVPPAFFRTAWKACVAATYAGQSLELFIADELQPLARWFFSSGQYHALDAGQLKAGWSALQRRYRESMPPPRHATQAEWPIPVWRVEFDGLRFVALASAAELQAEGTLMHHCIGSYDDNCRLSSLRAYAVSHLKSGQRMATLTAWFNPCSGFWELDDIKGPGNAEVALRIERASDALLRSLDDANARDPAFAAFLRKLATSCSSGEFFLEDEDALFGCPF